MSHTHTHSCQTSSSGAVDYKQFLQLINWKDHPLPTPHNTVRVTLCLSIINALSVEHNLQSVPLDYDTCPSHSVQQVCQDRGHLVEASLRASPVCITPHSCQHCRQHTTSHTLYITPLVVSLMTHCLNASHGENKYLHTEYLKIEDEWGSRLERKSKGGTEGRCISMVAKLWDGEMRRIKQGD